MIQQEFQRREAAVNLAISHVIEKGFDDIFKAPTFLDPLEAVMNLVLEN
ncbi:hypothetical protein [Roseomonas marmotae]|uniref:Uncharacterized protein n=1 Tax=Roseomonas marmotae TaxID=2768161 RepID=A0ABS3KG40_9PROT|nr:hypothetical protein [Roseomonas marmotae]MBO1076433.1 hypothetical protein [Roseomonas marmotae]